MRLQKTIRPFPFEWLTIIYAIVTTLIVLVSWSKLDNPLQQIIGRIGIIGTMLLIIYLSDTKFGSHKITTLVRVLYQVALLPFWYPEIHEFNKLFPNMDHIFANAEQLIFGMQPAVEFSRIFPRKWFSEAVYMGYFAYYPMIVGTILYSFFAKPEELKRLTSIIMGAFFVYYLIFIFVPVAGPQFYFLAIGMDNVHHAIFPAIGDYFRNSIEIMPGPGYTDGFFYHMIELVQAGGERPIAAFPSSHVGISTLLMIWLWHNGKKMFALLMPFYMLLCAATVYIQAHYLIDVFAGWASAFVLYFVITRIYSLMAKRRTGEDELRHKTDLPTNSPVSSYYSPQ